MPNVLHMICTPLRPGDLSLCVADKSWRSEKIKKENRIELFSVIIVVFIIQLLRTKITQSCSGFITEFKDQRKQYTHCWSVAAFEIYCGIFRIGDPCFESNL